MSAERRAILLRGVNVGGGNRLPMADLRDMLAGLGLGDPRTYIASGNAVVDSDLPCSALEAMIAPAIAARFGFAPSVRVLDRAAMRLAATDHPFAREAPAKVHVYFLRETPAALNDDAMRALAAPDDAWTLAPGRFTLSTPAGIGRSRLADKLHLWLPGDVTARNLNTVAAVLVMMADPTRA